MQTKFQPRYLQREKKKLETLGVQVVDEFSASVTGNREDSIHILFLSPILYRHLCPRDLIITLLLENVNS